MIGKASVLIAALVLGSALSSAASEGQPAASWEAEFARAFIGICAQNVGRNDKVAAYARAMGLEEISADMALALGPQDPTAKFTGWLVKDSTDQKYLLGISESEMQGRRMQSCSIANPDLNTELVLSEVSNLLDLGSMVFDENSLAQRQRLWELDSLAENAAVILINAVQPKTVGASLALMAPKEGTQ